jgi:hypothetical protein
MKGLEKKNWNSLSHLKEYLLKKKQKVVYFDGIYLETAKMRYSLGPDGLVTQKKG